MPNFNTFKKTLKSILIIFAACIGIGFLIYYYASKMLLNTTADSLTEMAKLGAKIAASDIQRRLQYLETIAKTNAIKNPNLSLKEKAEYLNKNFISENFLRLSVADSQGNVWTTDGNRINIGDREHFQKTIAGGKVVSNLLTSKIDGQTVVIFAIPLYTGGRINGILSGIYREEELSKISDGLKLGKQGNSFIIDRSGKVIAHDDRSLVYQQFNPIQEARRDPDLKELAGLIERMTQSKTGTGSYQYLGIDKYMGFAPIEGTDWSLAVAAPRSQIFRNINQLLVFLLGSFLVICINIIVLNFYMEYLRRRILKERKVSGNVIEVASIIVIKYDQQGNIFEFNKFAEMKTGFEKEEVIGKKKLSQLIAAEPDEGAAIFDSLAHGIYPRKTELAISHKNGGQIYFIGHRNCLDSETPNRRIYELMGFDFTEIVETEKRLRESHEQLAYHDSLTGLPNRLKLQSYWAEIIAERKDMKTAIIFVDSDNFKLINDTLGHNFGDKLIVAIGFRLQTILGDGPIVFRITGDEFVICTPGFDSVQQVEAVAKRIIQSISEPFELEDRRVHITVSMGISIYPDHATNVIEMLKNADIAMYKAKELGKNRYVFYDPIMQKNVDERMLLEKNLRNALSKNEFHLHYQPQIDVRTGAVSGFEALLRWSSPELGMVPPLKFIGITEESGMIIELGEWVLETACRFHKKLWQMTGTQFSIAVNVSIIQLMQDDFVQRVLGILEKHQINPEFVELEITESVLVETFETIFKTLKSLRDYQIKIALDDFGKGYSSLNYLCQLPISTLKIDKSFIDNIINSDNDRIITGDIVAIGHKEGLEVIAEGVETQEQMEYLTNHDCDKIQGYFYCKPLPEEEVIRFLKARK